MTIVPLKRNYALSVRVPNPMWIIGKDERDILEEALLPIKDSNGNSILYGALDCWDHALGQAEINVMALSSFNAEQASRAVITLHRETTLGYSTFIDIDGKAHRTKNKGHGINRAYFDGYSFSSLNYGHVAVACVDFERKKIWFQDPQGVSVKPDIMQLFQKYFSDYDIDDLQVKQQWDAHSCSVITLYNQEFFAQGELPLGHVDTQELRARYLQILEELQSGATAQQGQCFYDKPAYRLRYTPV